VVIIYVALLPAGIVAAFATDTQAGSDAKGNFVWRSKRVAPNAENSPAKFAKQPGNSTVAGGVAGDFAFPILAVSAGHAVVPRAAMPETTVNKDSQALTAENEVGTANERLVATPACDAGGAHDGDQLQLGGFIAARADGGHDFGPLFLCENVRHLESLAFS
jgi:hypothetical protein